VPDAKEEHKLSVAAIVLSGIRANAICRRAGVPMIGATSEAEFLQNTIELTTWALREMGELPCPTE